MNKEVNTFAVIPRTQRMGSTEHWPLRTEELLSKVIPKLEQYKKEQDINEKLKRRLQEEDTFDMNARQNYRHQGQALTDAILKKLPPVDDNDQSILDDHVSRVWSDLTPHRSPGTISPCPVMARRRTHDSGISGDSASSLGNCFKFDLWFVDTNFFSFRWPINSTLKINARACRHFTKTNK